MNSIQLRYWLSEHFLWIMLGLGAAFTLTWLLLHRKRLCLKWYAAVLLAILHTLYGVLCVKVFAFAESGFDGNKLGAMSLFGAVFLMPPAYWLGAKLFKRKPADVFDVFTVCMIFTLLCARCNCLVAGCCQGRQIGDSGLRWPTREAELVFYLIFLGCIIPRVWKGRTNGEVYPLYMAAYGTFRFITECFRDSATPGIFHVSHIWAALTLALGFSIYFEMKKKAKDDPKRTAKSKKR